MSWFQIRARSQLRAFPQGLTPWGEREPPLGFVSQFQLRAPSLSIPDLCLRLVEAAR
jgi:hypothetical protein